jgi:replicative DNA helicase
MSIERTILKNLVKSEDYSRKVLPFIKPEYFSDNAEKQVFIQIHDFIIKYNSLPTVESLSIALDGVTQGITDAELEQTGKILDEFKQFTPVDAKWLIDNTEKFCQDRALFNAMTQALNIMSDKNKKMTKGAIPKLLSDALAVTFDPNVGHNYFKQAEERFDEYHRVDIKFPFDLKHFNKITKNGFPRKTLNVILAGTGVGKSLMMCHMAAAAAAQGKNVLYITLELSAIKVSERIDANLLNIALDDIEKLPKDAYLKRIETLRNKITGDIVVKEYPTSTANAMHFKALLNELQLKNNFKPDIIFIDYLNICSSSRFKAGQAGMYDYIKSIAEEFRGLAVENDVPIVTATQTNRAGFVNSDPGLEHTSESFGLPATADFMIAVVSSEQLEKLGQYMVIQLKNRYSDLNRYKKFVIGVDKTKMKLFDVEDSAQTLSQPHSAQSQPPAAPVAKSQPRVDSRSATKNKFASLKV